MKDSLVRPLRWKKESKRKGKILWTKKLTYWDWLEIESDLKLRKEKNLELVMGTAIKKLRKRKDFVTFKKLRKVYARIKKKRRRKLLKRAKFLKNFFKESVKIKHYKKIKKMKKFKKKKKKKFTRKKLRILLKFYNKKLINKTKIEKNNIKTCYIILKHSFNNFFIIITDMNGRVISYCTSGQVCESKSIRKKRSYFLVQYMVNKLLFKLKKLNIEDIKIKIRSNITYHVRKVIFFLMQHEFKIKKIFFLKPIPHHFGQRRKKLRRL